VSVVVLDLVGSSVFVGDCALPVVAGYAYLSFGGWWLWAWLDSYAFGVGGFDSLGADLDLGWGFLD